VTIRKLNTLKINTRQLNLFRGGVKAEEQQKQWDITTIGKVSPTSFILNTWSKWTKVTHDK